MVNRTQALVLGFFVVALASLVVILVAAPEVYDQALHLREGSAAMEVAFLVVLTAFIGLLTVGVPALAVDLLADSGGFLAGVLRVPVAVLQLTGVLAAEVPPGTSSSRASSVWFRSPSAWPCWPVTGALASGAPSELAWRHRQHRCQAIGPALPIRPHGKI